MASLKNSRLSAAYEQLTEDERAVFLARYVCCITTERSIEQLGITKSEYEERLGSCLRKLRRPPVDFTDQFVPEIA